MRWGGWWCVCVCVGGLNESGVGLARYERQAVGWIDGWMDVEMEVAGVAGGLNRVEPGLNRGLMVCVSVTNLFAFVSCRFTHTVFRTEHLTVGGTICPQM
jgi:hypothetical protein